MVPKQTTKVNKGNTLLQEQSFHVFPGSIFHKKYKTFMVLEMRLRVDVSSLDQKQNIVITSQDHLDPIPR